MSSNSSSELGLKCCKKYRSHNDDLSTRAVSVHQTLCTIAPVCDKVGITRISNITGLDNLRIPNYSVTVPGTEDSIWVYGGKGLTSFHAKASALMEAVERYSSLSDNFSGNYIRGTYHQLSKSYKVLHPDSVIESILDTYQDKHSVLDFLQGFDLFDSEEILVPAQLALSNYSPSPHASSVFAYTHTNGLASGNVLEEAVCHALCEVIERDAVSIADLCASSIPYTILEKIARSFENCEYSLTQISKRFVDDPSIFPDINLSEIVQLKPIKFLVEEFSRVGIPLLVKNITQEDIGIPTIVASAVDWITDDYGFLARGYGSHPDVRIAIIRAITEVSQTRAANIQGARDDLRKITYSNDNEIQERKWQFMHSLSTNDQQIFAKLSSINTYQNEDVLDDIKLILRSLKGAGLKKAIVVNLTNPKIGIPVGRVIVPGLETFEVAKLVLSENMAVGKRALTKFKRLTS